MGYPSCRLLRGVTLWERNGSRCDEKLAINKGKGGWGGDFYWRILTYVCRVCVMGCVGRRRTPGQPADTKTSSPGKDVKEKKGHVGETLFVSPLVDGM